MAKPGVQKHVHRLKKVKFKSGNATLFCTLPDCSYKINPSLALGKRSICWRCGDEFILNEYSLRLTKPHCESCHKSKGSDKELSNQTVATSENLQADKADNVSLSDRLTSIIRSASSEAEEDI